MIEVWGWSVKMQSLSSPKAKKEWLVKKYVIWILSLDLTYQTYWGTHEALILKFFLGNNFVFQK